MQPSSVTGDGSAGKFLVRNAQNGNARVWFMTEIISGKKSSKNGTSSNVLTAVRFHYCCRNSFFDIFSRSALMAALGAPINVVIPFSYNLP